MKTKNRFKAYLMLVCIMFQIFYPTISFSLSGGPFQPEFASFEDSDATDMVNLLTGDFTYNLPILSIPSPEGSYDLPLSYHAGIEIDEESSWVGLGWNINAGVLDRYVSIFPDDYDGTQLISQNITNPSLTGNGYSENYMFYNKYYDSNLGSSGYAVNVMDIVGFNKDSKSGVGTTVLGLTYNNRTGYKYDFVSSVTGLINLGSMVMPMSSQASLVWGIAQQGTKLTSIGNGPATAQIGGGGGNGLSVITTETGKYGFLNLGTKIAYKYFYYNSNSQNPYGVLYMGDVPQQQNYTKCNPNVTTGCFDAELVYNGNGFGGLSPQAIPKIYNSSFGGTYYPVHDFHVFYNANSYGDQVNPSSIAYDNYNVKAIGLSGAISPHRLEIGSFASHVFTDANDQSYSFVASPFLESNSDELSAFNVSKYKVPFRFLGDNSNSYTYNLTGTHDDIKTEFEIDWNYQNSNYFQVLLKDPKVFSYGFSNNIKKENSRTNNSLYNNKLTHGNNIQWFTNDEIAASNFAKSVGFIDCGINRSTFPNKGVGGFSITREDGRTYHFSLPVYNKSEYRRTESNGFISRNENNNPYAIMWLLTAITGADFVDRGTLGIIDEDDWGYWVKFEYGMYNNNFMWRNPYFGKQVSPDGASNSFQRGVRQQYYLNFIKTRSHTAIFSKSLKDDGKSFYSSNGLDYFNTSDASNSDQISNYTTPSSTLKLDDIFVLANETFNELYKPVINGGIGLTLPSGYNGAINFQNNIVSNLTSNVVTSNQLTSSASVSNYIKNNQLQRIHFNYDYSLCDKTINSFNNEGISVTYNVTDYNSIDFGLRKGKLTLKSVDFTGKNDEKTMPGYEFDYGSSINNPNYTLTNYDGFGLYNSNGINSHKTTSSGSEWSLRKIITPLGSEIRIEYERDKYSEVNGFASFSEINIPLKNTNPIILGPPIQIFVNNSISTISSVLSLNSIGFIDYKTTPTSNVWLRQKFLVTSINETQKFFEVIPIGSSGFGTAGEKCVINKTEEKYGGNLRVKEIINADESGNQYYTRYSYNKINNSNISSGVASFESEYDKPLNTTYDFYSLYDHPSTTIMYKNVSVSRGAIISNNYEENEKTAFTFCTPNANQITISNDYNVYTQNSGPGFGADKGPTYKFFNKAGHVKIYDRTSQIGRLEKVVNYNKRGEALSSVIYEYFDNSPSGNAPQTGDNMGIYSESNFLFESFKDPVKSSFASTQSNPKKVIVKKFIQTSKVKYPNILKSITVNRAGSYNKTEYLEYDFNTSKPTKTLYTFGEDVSYLTEVIPAYKKYPNMGSKIFPSNRNMMSSTTQVKNYVTDLFGTGDLLLSSDVTTYKSNNLYRTFNGTNFISGTATFQGSMVGHWDIYGPFLTDKSYTWKSSVEGNGTIKNTNYVEFNWTSNLQSNKWFKNGESTLYDKFSHVLEMSDNNGRKSSFKYSHNNAFQIAAAQDMPYGSWCFSGAEDIEGYGYFGGEVFGSSTQFKSTTFSHTGNFSSRCFEGNTGFVFRGNYNTDFLPNKTYRAAVWVHNSNAVDAILYCNIKNGLLNTSPVVNTFNTSFTSPSVKQFGNWYLFILDVTIPQNNAYQQIEFGVQNPNGGFNPALPVYFDDFKVSLIGSELVTNVYEQNTGRVIAVLDKDNIAEKFYYDAAGRIIKTEKETKIGFIKVMEQTHNFKK